MAATPTPQAVRVASVNSTICGSTYFFPMLANSRVHTSSVSASTCDTNRFMSSSVFTAVPPGSPGMSVGERRATGPGRSCCSDCGICTCGKLPSLRSSSGLMPMAQRMRPMTMRVPRLPPVSGI